MKIIGYLKEHLKTIIMISQVVVSLLLIVVILLQSKGASLSEIFGGSGNIYATKRGVERYLHILTIFLAVLFFVLAIISLKIQG